MPEAIEVSLPPGRFLSAVLSRVVSLLAARADFSIGRLSDAQLVSDALASHVPRHTVDGRVTVHVRETEDSFELRVGPLVSGGGERLVRDTELPGVGPLLEQLSTELESSPSRRSAKASRPRPCGSRSGRAAHAEPVLDDRRIP